MSARQIRIYTSFIFLGLVCLLWSLNQAQKYLQVSFLDVGQGDAILLRTTQGVNILVDGGPDNSLLYQLADQLPWWERRIDYLFITHWDDDHYVGAIQLLKKYQVKHIFASYLPDKANANYTAWQRTLEQESIAVQILKKGEKINIDNQLRGVVLSASQADKLANNAKSLVVRWSYGDVDFLLTGDLPAEQEAEILSSVYVLDSEVLKVGHHGSKYSSSADFLAKVKPELCIIEVGANNKFGHPSKDALDRLQKAACDIRQTKDFGTITVLSDGQSWRIK
ncbi:MAG: MBL fold metallo-hydrolase [Patescibacteria group bacterium]